ncbi:MAG: class I SAM-dependent methyltransferase [Crocinitomicaceae bacterium]
MAEWYKDWFNTTYYHVLYKDRDHDEAKEFIRHLYAYLNLRPYQKTLDLACGRGRHALFLNQLGLDTVGVDLSKESIRYAKKFEKEGLRFAVHDMRDPLPGEKFDVVLNLFTSFGYFGSLSENGKVLRSIASYLKKEGDLIIDFMNVVKVKKHLDEQAEEVKNVEGINFEIKKSMDQGCIVKTISFQDKEEHFRFREKVQALTLSDFEKLLGENGFNLINKFGDYQLNEFSIEQSERLIIHAKLK